MAEIIIKVCRFCMSPYKIISGKKETLIRNKRDVVFDNIGKNTLILEIKAGICQECLYGKEE